MSQPRRPFTSDTGYCALLALLIRTREQRGLSQQQVADLIGLTPGQVQAYESGEVPLAFHDAKRWFIALNIPISITSHPAFRSSQKRLPYTYPPPQS